MQASTRCTLRGAVYSGTPMSGWGAPQALPSPWCRRRVTPRRVVRQRTFLLAQVQALGLALARARARRTRWQRSHRSVRRTRAGVAAACTAVGVAGVLDATHSSLHLGARTSAWTPLRGMPHGRHLSPTATPIFGTWLKSKSASRAALRVSPRACGVPRRLGRTTGGVSCNNRGVQLARTMLGPPLARPQNATQTEPRAWRQ